MRILTPKEVKDYGIHHGPSKNPAIAEIKKLEVGQTLLIETADWKKKTPPSVMVGGAIRNGMKFSVRTVQEGWTVTRIK